MMQKQMLVLGRRDHAEAMRVAAGLTIFGHKVRLVFMNGPVEETPENLEQAETLELCDIEPETTVAGQDLPCLDSHTLALAMITADAVISL
jgi:hypothetical protein